MDVNLVSCFCVLTLCRILTLDCWPCKVVLIVSLECWIWMLVCGVEFGCWFGVLNLDGSLECWIWMLSWGVEFVRQVGVLNLDGSLGFHPWIVVCVLNLNVSLEYCHLKVLLNVVNGNLQGDDSGCVRLKSWPLAMTWGVPGRPLTVL